MTLIHHYQTLPQCGFPFPEGGNDENGNVVFGKLHVAKVLELKNFINQPLCLSLLAWSIVNPIWHEEGRIYPPYIALDFVSSIFIKKFQTFSSVKIEINRNNLTPCQAH